MSAEVVSPAVFEWLIGYMRGPLSKLFCVIVAFCFTMSVVQIVFPCSEERGF